MKLTNNQIYNYSAQLNQLNINDIKLPVRINFFLQKNIQKVIQLGQEIDQARMTLAAQYGTPNAEGNGYDIPRENMQIINQELNDLFNLEQEVDLHIFKLDNFDNIELTYQQLSAIMFMIEE